MDGDGEYIFPDGKVYEGQFKAGLMHGVGCLTCPKEGEQFGLWEDGIYTGIRDPESKK